MVSDETKQSILDARKKIAESRTLQGQQRFKQALDTLNEALAVVDGLDDGSDEVTEARLTVQADLALLMQRLRDPRAALEHYREAIRLGESLPLDGEDGRYRLHLATTLINVAGLYARERMIEDGLDAARRAAELVDGIEGKLAPSARALRVGALQNRASLELEARDIAAAESTLVEAWALGDTAVNEGASQIVPQVIDIGMRLSAILRRQNRADDALPYAERAARLAEAVYETGSPLGPRLYTGTQLQLVDAHFAARNFARAEDHLFKAVEVISGTPQAGETLLIGTSFYFSLLRLTDDELAAGDLPRDEARDALDELIDQVTSLKAPEVLREILDGRRAATVDRDLAAARRTLESMGGRDFSSVPVASQLVPLLRGDVEWLQKLD
jgi:tetratricopeptide (TPR) repeat protein